MKSGWLIVACLGPLAAGVHGQSPDGSDAQAFGNFGWHAVCPGDLDSDGIEDLVVGSETGVRGEALWAVAACDFSALWGTRVPRGSAATTAAFARAEPFLESAIVAMAPAGDLDLDGTPDLLLIVHPWNDNRTQLLAIDGANGRLIHQSDGCDVARMAGPSLVSLADLDQDGRLDYAAAWNPGDSQLARVELRSGRDGSVLKSSELPADPYLRPKAMEYVPKGGGGQGELWIALAWRQSHPMPGGKGELPPGRVLRLSTRDLSVRGTIEVASDLRVPDTVEGAAASFGSSLAALGDVDGDGCPEVAIGAPGSLFRQNPFVMWFDGATGEAGGLLSAGPDGFSGLGWCVEPGPDVNGDGLPEALLTGPQAGALGQGACELVEVRTGRTLRKWEAPEGGGPGGWGFGISAATIGDLDGDGVRDVAIGMGWHLSPGERKQVRFYSAGTGRFLRFVVAEGLIR